MEQLLIKAAFVTAGLNNKRLISIQLRVTYFSSIRVRIFFNQMLPTSGLIILLHNNELEKSMDGKATTDVW